MIWRELEFLEHSSFREDVMEVSQEVVRSQPSILEYKDDILQISVRPYAEDGGALFAVTGV